MRIGFTALLGMTLALCFALPTLATPDQTPPSRIRQLVQQLSDEDEDVQAQAEEQLRQVSDLGEIQELLDIVAATTIDMYGATQALKLIGQPAYPALLEAMKSDSDTLRGIAASVLKQSGAPELIAPVTALLKDGSPRTRAAAADVLSSSSEETAIDALIAALSDPDATVRNIVVSALKDRRSNRVNAALLPLLQDKDAGVRSLTFVSLEPDQWWDPMPILRIATRGPDASVRADAAAHLGGADSPEALDLLSTLLRDPDEYVRRKALDAIHAALPTEKRLLDLLHSALSDPDPRVRAEATDVFARSGAQMVPALQPLLRDNDPWVRYRAAVGLIASGNVQMLEPALPVFVEAAAKNSEFYFGSLELVTGLRAMGAPAYDALLPYLSDRRPTVRRFAVDALVATQDARVKATILQALKQERDEGVCQMVADALLSWMNPPDLIKGADSLLASHNSYLRWLGMTLLSVADDPTATRRLVNLLKNEDADTREGAAQSLAYRLAYGLDTSLIPTVVKLLDDKSSDLRDAAISALQLAGPAAVQPLLDALGSQYPEIRGAAIEGLWQHANDEIVERLVGMMHDSDRNVRTSAAYTLVLIDTPRTRALLSDALRAYADPHTRTDDNALALALNILGDRDEVKQDVAHALARLDSAADRDALMRIANELDGLPCEIALCALLHAKDPETVRQAIRWNLQQRGDIPLSRNELLNCGTQAVDVLLEELQKPTSSHRAYAARTLGWMKDTRAVEPLMGALQGANALMRRNVAWSLGQLADRRAVTVLTVLTQDDNADVRSAAIMALTNAGTRDSADYMLAGLNDPMTVVREAAATALGKSRDPRAFDALIPLLDAGPLQSAAAGLGYLGDQRATDRLITLLGEPDPDSRKAAVAALGQLRDPRAYDALVNQLDDKDDHVWRAAAVSLGLLDDTRAIPHVLAAIASWSPGVDDDPSMGKFRMFSLPEDAPALILLLRAEDATVRRDAAAALAEDDVDFDEDADRWMAWWEEQCPPLPPLTPEDTWR